MVHYVFTPWRDRRELLAVRRQFYPDGTAASALARPADAGAAVARVAVWMQRGQCPHMVESTALLAAVMLGDGDGAGGTAGTGTPAAAYTNRAAYAAAFARFVTGLLDGHQDRARKLSMHGLARAVGLPPAFVELRHQATHEPLPSLRRLRAGARQALGWIWQYYWEGLGGDEDGEGEGGEEEEDVQTAVAVCVDDNGDIASAVRRYGDKAVLAALAALAALADNATPARTLRCMQLSREVLEVKEEGEKEQKEKETTTTETGDNSTWPWTAANLDLDAMRAAMAQQRQALYEIGDQGEEEETEQRDGEEDEDDDNDHDITMADDNNADSNADNADDNEWPAPRPRWTRYDGDWTAQPIGIVIRA